MILNFMGRLDDLCSTVMERHTHSFFMALCHDACRGLCSIYVYSKDCATRMSHESQWYKIGMVPAKYPLIGRRHYVA